MTNEEAIKLLENYNRGVATPTEAALLKYWYIHEASKYDIEVTASAFSSVSEVMRAEVLSRTKPNRRAWSFSKFAAAAAVVVIVSVGIWKISSLYKTNPDIPEFVAGTKDIAPGKIGAMLVLSNGEKIHLSDAPAGVIADQAGISVKKTATGELIYENNNPTQTGKMLNTLSTARGETYRLSLPDGSKVWLNAASSLTYAAGLLNNGVRKVSLIGEAYFEVYKDKDHPFFVESRGQKVRVLGTHFNINAYPDQDFVKTTLIEGSVNVESAGTKAKLQPKQQAVFINGKMSVGTADVDLALAWKNNEIMFNEESIDNIMKTVERWYDVEVIYTGEKPAQRITGGLSKTNNLSKVLQIIQSAGGAHFKVAGKKIYVSK